MLIGKAPDVRYSEITPRSVYLKRREFLQAASIAALGTAAALAPGFATDADAQVAGPGKLPKLANVKKSPFSTTEKLSSYADITTYNNFYEFGTDKEAPSARAKS